MPLKKKHHGAKHKSQPLKVTMADKADKHTLYEQAVQCSEAEIDFVDETFQSLRGRKAHTLREDFCGTANTSCEWARRCHTNRAICIDLDPDVLKWGRKHNVNALKASEQKRITMVHGDVMKVKTEPADMVLAMNFSYWLFKDRPSLLRYFQRVHDGLVQDGIFFLDACGGFEALREMEECTAYDKFTYIWD